jgi:hypothetical protein
LNQTLLVPLFGDGDGHFQWLFDNIWFKVIGLLFVLLRTFESNLPIGTKVVGPFVCLFDL